jgi:hypothetical protein
MANLALSPIAAQPPPDLPSDPSLSPQLTNYLRTFSLWCRHGFAAKLGANTALPGILLQANDAPAGTTPAVFMLQVTTAGTIVATPMPLGSGRP